jgi:monoamine oxidase
VLLEARDSLGGRIASFTASGHAATADAIDRFDLGPTWLWPGYQRELQQLINDLGLEQFEQFETGDILVERSSDEPPTRTRLFGPQASTPRADVIKDWAQDPYTATAADVEATAHHGEPPAATAESGQWHGRMTGIASEWSPQFPGYVAGAIETAGLGVQAALGLVPAHRAHPSASIIQAD